jgi:hypothetical protein
MQLTWCESQGVYRSCALHLSRQPLVSFWKLFDGARRASSLSTLRTWSTVVARWYDIETHEIKLYNAYATLTSRDPAVNSFQQHNLNENKCLERPRLH